MGNLTLIGKRFHFPLALSLVYQPTRAHVALLGDAAHGIHPLAGQGLNLGFGDIASLVEVLALAKRRGEDFTKASVLKRYATQRRAEITAMGAATDGLNKFFSTAFGAPSFLPQFGTAIAQGSPFLRKLMMQNASGTSGNQPKLLRGILP